MIEQLAKSILGKLASNSVEYIIEEIKEAKSTKKNLKLMCDNMKSICAILKDAENKGYTSEGIKVWLGDLKNVLYNIDDLLDEVSYDAKLRMVNEGRFTRQLRYYASSSNPIISPFVLSHKIKDLGEKLDNIVARKDKFELAKDLVDHSSSKDEIRDPYDRCNFVDKPSIIGRDEAKHDILNIISMVRDATELSVLPIVGMGGIGKTTLAKLVYEDVQNFDNKLWACASDQFQISQIVEDILKDGSGDATPNQNFNMIVKKLKDFLKDKKYFLVLDDVWVEDIALWRKLKGLLAIGKPGCVILITTRNANVASITKTNNMEPYDLDSLPEHVCWSIFESLAFTEGEETRYPRLYEIGKSIIKKCCGIPLVIITLGSLLRSERDDKKWKELEEMDSFVQLDQDYDNFMQLLKLSYNKLPSHLKPCFAYLALYAKDTKLGLSYVSHMWSALGLLENESIEDYGYSYLMELVSRSLLELNMHIENFYWSGKMHDFLHDLAMNILGEDLRVVTLNKVVVSEDTRFIVWGYEEGDVLKDIKFPIELQNAKNARTFRFGYKMHHISQSILEGIISHLSCLRILELGNGWFENLPESIGKLKHLRYLELSNNPILRNIPNVICKLLNLEYLNFCGCEQLKEIPKDIFQLQNLRYLGVTTCQISLVETKLNKLSSLHTLLIESCKSLEYLWKGGDGEHLASLRRLKILNCPKLRCLPKSMKFLFRLQVLTIENCEELELEEVGLLQGLHSLRHLDVTGVPNISEVIQDVATSSKNLLFENSKLSSMLFKTKWSGETSGKDSYNYPIPCSIINKSDTVLESSSLRAALGRNRRYRGPRINWRGLLHMPRFLSVGHLPRLASPTRMLVMSDYEAVEFPFADRVLQTEDGEVLEVIEAAPESRRFAYHAFPGGIESVPRESVLRILDVVDALKEHIRKLKRGALM